MSNSINGLVNGLVNNSLVYGLISYRPRGDMYDKYDRCGKCCKWFPKSKSIRCPICNWRMHKVNRRNKSPEARRKNIVKQRLIRKFGTCIGYTEADLNMVEVVGTTLL